MKVEPQAGFAFASDETQARYFGGMHDRVMRRRDGITAICSNLDIAKASGFRWADKRIMETAMSESFDLSEEWHAADVPWCPELGFEEKLFAPGSGTYGWWPSS